MYLPVKWVYVYLFLLLSKVENNMNLQKISNLHFNKKKKLHV